MRHVMSAVLLLATPALADDLRTPCFDRPGRLTPPCIVDAGHVAVEIGVADFSHDRRAAATSDTLTLADTVVRLGLTSHLEAIGAWSPYERIAVHPRSDATSVDHGSGDFSFGLKQSLLAPDGQGVSIALQPFASVDHGTWTEGLIVPASIALPHDVTLGLTGEVDRLPGDHGHHAAYTGIVGLSRQFGAVTPGVELYLSRDDDPGDHATDATADLFVAYIPPTAPTLQFDGEVEVGISRTAPDVAVSIGVAKRF